MKFTITDLRKKIEDVPGIMGLFFAEDLVINDKLDVYLKKRVSPNKPHLKPNERLLIKGIHFEQVARQITEDAIDTIFAIKSVQFKTQHPDTLDKNDANHDSVTYAYGHERNKFVQKYAKEIKEQAHLTQMQMIAKLIFDINHVQLRQILDSFGYKNTNEMVEDPDTLGGEL